MNPFFHRALLLSALLLPFNLCAQDVRVVTRVVKDTVPAWKVWKSDAFSIRHPGKWAVETPAAGDTVVVFRRLDTPVRMIVQGIDGKAAPFKQRIAAQHAVGLEVIDSGGDNGEGTHWAEYEYGTEGSRVHLLQRVQEADGRSYIFTYAAPAASYDDYLYVAEAMYNSFAPATGGK